MTDSDILIILKVDLQLSSTAIDGYLTSLIDAARQYITQEGIALQTTVADAMLVEMYAAYLYRSRREDAQGMPRYLRWALNNRLLTEKAGAGE